MRFIKRNPEYEALIYCGFCNQYAIYHEHECNNNPPQDPYDGYPFDAYDTDQHSPLRIASPKNDSDIIHQFRTSFLQKDLLELEEKVSPAFSED